MPLLRVPHLFFNPQSSFFNILYLSIIINSVVFMHTLLTSYTPKKWKYQQTKVIFSLCIFLFKYLSLLKAPLASFWLSTTSSGWRLVGPVEGSWPVFLPTLLSFFWAFFLSSLYFCFGFLLEKHEKKGRTKTRKRRGRASNVELHLWISI